MTRTIALVAQHSVTSLATLILFGAYAVFAWTGPSVAAPNGNVLAPLNVGTVTQGKAGSLTLEGLSVYGVSLLQYGGNYDVWVQGGAGASGDLRNLALLGTTDASTDTLYVNYNGEYAGGTRLGGNVYAAGYFHTSDARLKKDIRPIKGIDIVKRLNGVLFAWKDSGKESAGVIAQDVEKVLPEAVITDAEGIKSVDYDALIAPLIEAVKEQQTEIDSLKKEVEALKSAR